MINELRLTDTESQNEEKVIMPDMTYHESGQQNLTNKQKCNPEDSNSFRSRDWEQMRNSEEQPSNRRKETNSQVCFEPIKHF